MINLKRFSFIISCENEIIFYGNSLQNIIQPLTKILFILAEKSMNRQLHQYSLSYLIFYSSIAFSQLKKCVTLLYAFIQAIDLYAFRFFSLVLIYNKLIFMFAKLDWCWCMCIVFRNFIFSYASYFDTSKNLLKNINIWIFSFIF